MSTINYTNNRFNLTYSGGFFKIEFVAPLSETFYFNRELLNIRLSPLSVNHVDLGQFDWGILTVNWALCNTIGGGDRVSWVTAVIASITVPNFGPTALAASAQTDSIVGYNNTTKEFTDLGNAPRQRFEVYSTVNTALPATFPGAKLQFNVVVDDPLSMFNTTTNLVTIQQTGYYIFGGSVYSTSSGYIYIGVNGSSNDRMWSSGNTPASHVTGGMWLTAGDTVGLYSYGVVVAITSIFRRLNGFWGKRIV